MTAYRIAGATSLVLVLGASGAFADVTADEVWEDFRTLLAGGDMTVTTEGEERSGDTLTVRGVTVAGTTPEGGLSAELGDIGFREQGDGTVALILPDSHSATFRGTTSDEPPVPTSGTLEVSQPDIEVVVSGDAESRDWAVTAPEITIVGVDFTEGGEPVEMDLRATIRALDGRYTVTDEEVREIASDFTAEAVEIAVDAPDEEGGRAAVTFSFDDVNSIGRATGMPIGPMVDLSAALADGFSGEGEVEFAASRFTIDGENDDGSFLLDGGTGPGALDVALAETGIAYGNTAEDLRLTVSGSQIPVPEVAFAAAESTTRISLPVLPGVGDGKFDMVVRLVDLVLPEALWSMLDPSAVLPRDPATFVVDVTGELDLTRPLLEEPAETATATEGEESAPGTLEALTVEELRLSAAGAEVSGTGELTFDADETEVYGMPQPVGTVELRLVGLQTLLDNLVKIGLLPEDQVLGARMMLGAFARQAEGDDTLTSTIEFTPDGEILANGTRIR